jgi:hypothetical protein
VTPSLFAKYVVAAARVVAAATGVRVVEDDGMCVFRAEEDGLLVTFGNGAAYVSVFTEYGPWDTAAVVADMVTAVDALKRQNPTPPTGEMGSGS